MVSFFYFLLCFVHGLYIASLPFPVEEEGDDDGEQEGGGDAADRGGPRHPGMGKGLSVEQKKGVEMVKHILLSLDEEDGLDEIYSFRSEGCYHMLDDYFFICYLIHIWLCL